MRKAMVLAAVGILVVLVLCTINYAQEVGQAKRPNEDDAQPVEIGEYEYVIASTLDEEREKFVGKYIKIVDHMAVLWDDPTPHDSKEEREEADQKGYKGDHDNQTLKSKNDYIKFETFYFRCLLPDELESSVNYLYRLNRQKVYDDVNQIKPEPKVITIYGKLVRTTVWGKVAERGAALGTETEDIVIMVHKIERPPKRFYKDVPNEEDQ